MKVIGIGGPTGAGKTLLCDYFDKQGFHVIDVDVLAHKLYQQQEVIDQVTSLFPTACDLGRVNRAKLAEIVFSDQTELDKLNQLMTPLLEVAVKANIHPTKHTLVDMAILFDTNVVSLCDATVFMTADEMIRKRRIVLRGNSPETASKMIARQEYMLDSANQASLVITNNEEFAPVIAQLESFLAQVTG